MNIECVPSVVLIAAIGVSCQLVGGCTGREPAPFVVDRPASGLRDGGRDSGTRGNGGEGGEQTETVDSAQANSDTGYHDGSIEDAADARAQEIKPTSLHKLSVLFVGNSHTFTNDLPSLVKALAYKAGVEVVTRSATPGGYGFVEHAQDAQTLAAIEAEPWDVVVLQDQQQRPGWRPTEIEAKHLPSLQTLDGAITANRADTRKLMFMVWARQNGDVDGCEYYPPDCSFEGDTRAIEQGYAFYAERIGADLAPVALAWAKVRTDSAAPLPPLSLWQSDGSHPALTGSYLAASVIVRALLNTEVAPLAYEAGLDPTVASYLRDIADQTVADYDSDPRVQTVERVSISCDSGDICDRFVEAFPVVFTLSTDDCAALEDGTAAVNGRIRTNTSCFYSCGTVALGGWREVPGAVVADGLYQVYVQIDTNDNGTVDTGVLTACETEAFEVGSGEPLVIDALGVR